jgi:hypothetical protein
MVASMMMVSTTSTTLKPNGTVGVRQSAMLHAAKLTPESASVNYKMYNTYAEEYEPGLSNEVAREMQENFHDDRFPTDALKARNKQHQIRTGADTGSLDDNWKFMSREYDREAEQKKVFNDWDDARRESDPKANRQYPNNILYNADYVNRGVGDEDVFMPQGNMRNAFINDGRRGERHA